MNIDSIAYVCHEANKAYCNSIGDHSQLPWDLSEDWQRVSAIKGVEFCIANPEAPPSANHDSWLAEKIATGWIYGDVKDSMKKTHPCIVSYNDLPPEQKAKDALFKAIVGALAPYLSK